ncbi:hypothetical protein BU14_0855s0002 [Porphyra umbilicalis]|uniref:Uncharacterized protein n=1 Tax=Porphyra umbilicalis TaxID=2786 RepID=A0A1X6NNZ3_PORUM|nr:hypothetical protein BU14_0855s0002 [Porphyra umbilicalis]|eukprot:OSX70206.1 hypothetical protein BU14_0855s0002 [Porphyra umbilicalis]
MAPSAPPRHVFVENVGGGVALISLYRPPVNAMNGAVWEQLLAALAACEAAAADGRPPPVTPPLPPGASRAAFSTPDAKAAASPTRAIIFTSALPRPIFTAGNDISELHVPSTSRIRFDGFWVTSATFLARLYASPLHTVAAVAGACPAGGTALALACDERVAAAGGGTALGLNEVALGIPVPAMWARLLARVVGWAPAEALLRGGVMLPAAAAAKTGLVDELVEPGAPAGGRGAGEAVVTAALRRARRQLRLADPGRVATKSALRGGFAAEWAVDAPADASRVWGLLTQPAVVATLGRVLAQLAGRKGDTRGRGKL